MNKLTMVRYTKEKLPKPNAEDIARLEALALRPDSEIDFTDIPEMTADGWKTAIRGKFYRPAKF